MDYNFSQGKQGVNMKFEFVEFYPINSAVKAKDLENIGTIHIYVVDHGLDIRGIVVKKRANSIFFKFPHFKAFDPEENKIVTYPYIKWTKDEDNVKMLDFLHQVVKPEIRKRIKPKKSKQ